MLEDLRRKYDNEHLVEHYDGRYSDFQGRRSDRSVWRALRRALHPDCIDGRPVLDMPCGTGRLFERLAALGARVIAIDRSLKMLRRAPPERLASGQIQRIQSDGLALPVRERTFAAVFCVRFLHLLEPGWRVAFLRSLAAVAEGPLLAVYYPNHSLKTLTRALRRRLGLRGPDRARWIPWRAIREEIAAAGLICTRRVAEFPLLANGVVLRLEKRSKINGTDLSPGT